MGNEVFSKAVVVGMQQNDNLTLMNAERFA